jgi:drug/metabolite transporter (DMT)-like permease
MLIESIGGPIWVWLFFNEIPPMNVFIAGLLIMIAVVIKSLEKAKPAQINYN